LSIARFVAMTTPPFLCVIFYTTQRVMSRQNASNTQNASNIKIPYFEHPDKGQLFKNCETPHKLQGVLEKPNFSLN